MLGTQFTCEHRGVLPVRAQELLLQRWLHDGLVRMSTCVCAALGRHTTLMIKVLGALPAGGAGGRAARWKRTGRGGFDAPPDSSTLAALSAAVRKVLPCAGLQE